MVVNIYIIIIQITKHTKNFINKRLLKEVCYSSNLSKLTKQKRLYSFVI